MLKTGMKRQIKSNYYEKYLCMGPKLHYEGSHGSKIIIRYIYLLKLCRYSYTLPNKSDDEKR